MTSDHIFNDMTTRKKTLVTIFSPKSIFCRVALSSRKLFDFDIKKTCFNCSHPYEPNKNIGPYILAQVRLYISSHRIVCHSVSYLRSFTVELLYVDHGNEKCRRMSYLKRLENLKFSIFRHFHLPNSSEWTGPPKFLSSFHVSDPHISVFLYSSTN